MPWQLTTLLASVARVFGARRRWTSEDSLAQARALTHRRAQGGPNAVGRAYERAAARLTEEQRFGLAKAIVDADEAGRAATEGVLAAGAPAAVAIAFARAWSSLSPMERRLATDPLGRDHPGPVAWGDYEAGQIDGTTCGAAVMTMMAMIGDPTLGLWLASGTLVEGHVPPEVARIPADAPIESLDGRWAALQRSVHRHTTRRAVGPFPWPRMFGTPPWRVNNTVRFLGIGFRGAVADDTFPDETRAMLDHAAAALADGVPVIMYASGDSARGIDAALPRHVVLLTHRLDDAFLVYEPGSAALHRIADAQILAGGKALRGLGNWSHVSWFVLPRARRPREQLALET